MHLNFKLLLLFFFHKLSIGGTFFTGKKDFEIPPLLRKKALKEIFFEFGSVGVSLGRRPPKRYRGRAKVRNYPIRGLV